MKLRIPPKIYWLKIFALLFWLTLGCVSLYINTRFVIKKISCSVQDHACPDYVQAELEKNIGKSIFFTPYEQVIAVVIKREPSLQMGQMTKNLEGEVTFHFEYSQAVYALKNQHSPLFLVSMDGLILNTSEQTNLPQLVLDDESIPLGQGVQLSQGLATQLKTLFTQLKNLAIPYTALTLSKNGELEIQLPDGKRAVVLLEEAPEKLPQLQYLLQHQDQLQTKEPFHLIDLRFKYPVLKT